ncbi:ADP/ATP carrier protein, partial [Cladochytrium tenue]
MATVGKLTPFGDAVAGALGAVVANFIVFPLDVVKTRLQVQQQKREDKEQHSQAVEEIHVLQERQQRLKARRTKLRRPSADSNADVEMDLVDDEGGVEAPFGEDESDADDDSGVATSSSSGDVKGAASLPATAPAPVSLQHSHHQQQRYDGALDALVKIVRHEGLGGLYAGLAAGLTGTVFSSFSYFYFYSLLRNGYIEALRARRARHGGASTPPPALSTAAELLVGALAGALSQLLTLPVAVVATRQQTAPRSERAGALRTATHVVAADGPAGLWRGLRASLVLCSNPAITYGAFERLRAALVAAKLARGRSAALGSLDIFAVGAASKTLATVATYP